MDCSPSGSPVGGIPCSIVLRPLSPVCPFKNSQRVPFDGCLCFSDGDHRFIGFSTRSSLVLSFVTFCPFPATLSGPPERLLLIPRGHLVSVLSLPFPPQPNCVSASDVPLKEVSFGVDLICCPLRDFTS